MANITLWKGSRRVVCGNDIEFVEYEEFEGETLGACWEEENSRGTHTTFYRAADGRVVVHVVRWSRWENEPEISEVFVFPSLAEAETRFWWEMENAGVIPRPTLTLDEVDGR